MCEGIFSVYVIIKFKIQRILDAFIYSKYPDQRKHVTTESGSADLAGGVMEVLYTQRSLIAVFCKYM